MPIGITVCAWYIARAFSIYSDMVYRSIRELRASCRPTACQGRLPKGRQQSAEVGGYVIEFKLTMF